MYYYAEATMKQIGVEIGVNESRVSQLHARAVQRLRKALGADCHTADLAATLRPGILSFQQTMRRMRMAKADLDPKPGVVLPYKTPEKPASARRSVPVQRREAVAAAR
jgi:hypothetical protein